MAPKRTIERTAASSRPKRTPKPATVAAPPAPALKFKKKTTATKKAATRTAAPKKTAASKVTKKTAPKKTAPEKAAQTKAAISSPVKKAQNTIVNASPVKKAQDALTRSRSKSPAKKMTSNDSGYQADNEQQSVMSRTWKLAANAVEAMKSAVNPE